MGGFSEITGEAIKDGMFVPVAAVRAAAEPEIGAEVGLNGVGVEKAGRIEVGDG